MSENICFHVFAPLRTLPVHCCAAPTLKQAGCADARNLCVCAGVINRWFRRNASTHCESCDSDAQAGMADCLHKVGDFTLPIGANTLEKVRASSNVRISVSSSQLRISLRGP
ncbi:hypothetical protein thalar_01380 [Litoreibacter arenae DSM 19593]|uniref:Uncharacterized protein n=1 Tax=Litoreibacter arenae DSM 19593 TaxID=1123360 RepID=S9S1F3_9RHOB|nr:hypothetical protein thalar_01380 [Litoreibacter arenae DSM 19593]